MNKKQAFLALGLTVFIFTIIVSIANFKNNENNLADVEKAEIVDQSSQLIYEE